MTVTEPSTVPMQSRFESVLGRPIASIERINGGSNSEVFKLVAETGEPYVAKIYGGPTADGKDRLSVEVMGLDYLIDHGFTDIPRPIAYEESQRCAVFEFVDGAKPNLDQISTVEIDQASSFLIELSRLTYDTSGSQLPTAAEACFSLDELVTNIARRLDRLRGLPKTGQSYTILHDFLEDEFQPTFQLVSSWCENRQTELGSTAFSVIPQSERVLSPSDFGFHNCLRRPNGQLAFLDFEYFGWDDPAKMLSDFLLHPAMKLDTSQKQRFLLKLSSLFESRPGLNDRLPVLYPLFGLKWCLIILNEFFPETMAKRKRSQGDDFNEESLLTSQMLKAKEMLNNVDQTYETFPYPGNENGANHN